jgi:hypothetical protein
MSNKKEDEFFLIKIYNEFEIRWMLYLYYVKRVNLPLTIQNSNIIIHSFSFDLGSLDC